MPTRRILHSTATPQAAPATGVNKPLVHNVLARLTRLVGILPYSKGYDKLYGLLGFLFTKSLTSSESLWMFLLAAMISSFI